MSKLKVAVVSAHYMPEVGYQEVHLAKAYARLGHTVKVFTSAAAVNLGGSLGISKYNEGISIDEKYGYEILRLPAFSYKSKAYSTKLKEEVLNFTPDLIVILGVAKGFPFPLLNKEVASKSKLVSLYGDAKEYFERNTFSEKVKALKYDIGFKLFKEPFYKKAVKYCHKIILNIPESDLYFQSFLGPNALKEYERKKVLLTLGFDPDEYFYTNETRINKRKELGVKDNEVVLITSTRINKRKRLESIIDNINTLNKSGLKVKYILVGFLDDAYERELKAYINSLEFRDNFICFPFLTAAQIRELYCAADAGVWLKAAISIQEAMGTGLPVILEDKPSVNHLVKNEHNGWYFKQGHLPEIINHAIQQLSEKKSDRDKLALENSDKLSYTNIAKRIAQLTLE